MRRKKRRCESQLFIEYPPELRSDHFKRFDELKGLYPGFVVFMLQDGFYLSIGRDAGQVSGIENILTSQTVQGECCFFGIGSFDMVMRKLVGNGLYIAICAPPHDVSQHLFT
jgi:hypothetical protein